VCSGDDPWVIAIELAGAGDTVLTGSGDEFVAVLHDTVGCVRAFAAEMDVLGGGVRNAATSLSATDDTAALLAAIQRVHDCLAGVERSCTAILKARGDRDV
jgi:hypothetical protein